MKVLLYRKPVNVPISMRPLVLQEVSVSEATSGIDFHRRFFFLAFRTQTRYRTQTRVHVVPLNVLRCYRLGIRSKHILH